MDVDEGPGVDAALCSGAAAAAAACRWRMRKTAVTATAASVRTSTSMPRMPGLEHRPQLRGLNPDPQTDRRTEKRAGRDTSVEQAEQEKGPPTRRSQVPCEAKGGKDGKGGQAARTIRAIRARGVLCGSGLRRPSVILAKGCFFRVNKNPRSHVHSPRRTKGKGGRSNQKEC